MNPDERDAEIERRSNEATRKDPEAENRQWIKTAFESGATLEDAQSFMVDQGFCSPEFFKKEATKYKWRTKTPAAPALPAPPAEVRETPEQKKRRMVAEAVFRQVEQLWQRYYAGRKKFFDADDSVRRATFVAQVCAGKAKNLQDDIARSKPDWARDDAKARQHLARVREYVDRLKASGDSAAAKDEVRKYERSMEDTRQRMRERADRLRIMETQLNDVVDKSAKALREREAALADRERLLGQARAAEDAYQSKRYELYMTFKNPELPDALREWRNGKHFDERSSDD